MVDDDKLLAQYARDGAEAAFGQLIARHLSLVYSTCLRETGSPSQAEDATQIVFLLLARKAKSLRAGPSLAGWLYNAARFVAKDIRKQEARRQRGEQTVMQEMTHRQETPAPEWERVEPLLNDALSALKPGEREAVLLRFLEGHSLAETGAALGLSEDAARMRVSRAVEKMRRYLTAHGAAVTGLLLTGLLTSEAARPAPAHAATVITQGTLQALSVGPTANISQLSEGVYRTMKLTKVKLAAFAAVLVLGGTALVPLASAVSTSRASKAEAPVDQAKQDAFLLGLTQYDCNQRAQKFNEAVGDLDNLHDADEVAAMLVLIRLQAGKGRERQARAYAQVSRILSQMNAPADLQDWADQSRVRLAAPVVVSPEAKVAADADLAKPRFAFVHDEQEVTTVYAVSEEMSDMQRATDAHRVALTSWLARCGDDVAWARDLGALTAELNWKEIKQERENPSAGSQTIAYSLSQTAPAGTPAITRQDLDRLSALGIGSNPTGPQLDQTFYGARADLLKTYGVKSTQFWPI